MIRHLIIFVLLSFAVQSRGQNIVIKEIRENFQKGVKDEDLCKKYYQLLQRGAKSECEKGYAAAFQMFMAKHTGNPIKKMSYFNGGKKLLEEQIKHSPNNIDLRFIRLTIQYHTPSFLGYKDNIKEDKEFMMHNLYKLEDVEGRHLLFKYLKGANMYSEQELLLLGR